MADHTALSKYFPVDRTEACYAVYATALDRFMLVDRHDLSLLVRAAMLFSSKVLTVVCVYDSRVNPRLSNDNCMRWAPVHRVSQSDNPYTTVLLLEGPNAIVEKGPVTTADGEALARAQRYLMFVARVMYAQFMTNASVGEPDLRLFRHMVPPFETLPEAPLTAAAQLYSGHVRDQRIEEILYYSEDIERAMANLDGLLRKEGPREFYTAFKEHLHGQQSAR
jgi:hypothetical protein